jgi:hypothetical protein
MLRMGNRGVAVGIRIAPAATICISSLAVVIIDKPGWPAHSGAICF